MAVGTHLSPSSRGAADSLREPAMSRITSFACNDRKRDGTELIEFRSIGRREEERCSLMLSESCNARSKSCGDSAEGNVELLGALK